MNNALICKGMPSVVEILCLGLRDTRGIAEEYGTL